MKTFSVLSFSVSAATRNARENEKDGVDYYFISMEEFKKKIRQMVHLSFAGIFLLFVMVFKWVNDPSMIGLLLKIAAYTYGPLLGLFSFGILTSKSVKDKLVPYICIASPILCFMLEKYQKVLFGSFEFGLELLIINGTITFLGLLLISADKQPSAAKTA